MVENEFKIMISDLQYFKLLSEAKQQGGCSSLQTNYYFDNSDLLLSKCNTTLRIRVKNNDYNLTIKQHFQALSDVKRSNETNIRITKDEAYKIINGEAPINGLLPANISVMNTSINLLDLKLIGRLETLRTAYAPKDFNIVIELDKNNYCNKCDYEIECEVKSELEEESARSFFQSKGITATNEIEGKYYRFIKALKNN